MTSTASTQNVARPGVIELAFGEPDPALFPAAGLAAACREALAEGGEALSYGANAGPAGLRRRLAERLTRLETRATGEDETLISGGNSQALEQLVTLFCRPGDVVLVERPTYSLALGILRDHPVVVEALPFDDKASTWRRSRNVSSKRGPRAARCGCSTPSPPFTTRPGSRWRPRGGGVSSRSPPPTASSSSKTTSTASSGTRPAPPSLWSMAAPGTVLRLGSFAKTLAPGLRVGWLNAAPAQIERVAASGLNDSGGCPSQFAAVAVERFLATGRYDPHVAELRAAYASRRDALAAALTERLPRGCGFSVPRGASSSG